MEITQERTENTYPIGHPWYYKLGGKIQKPTQIMLDVKAEQYRSYLKDDIEATNNKSEPKRTNQLMELKNRCSSRLKVDFEQYRKLVVELIGQSTISDFALSNCCFVILALSLTEIKLCE